MPDKEFMLGVRFQGREDSDQVVATWFSLQVSIHRPAGRVNPPIHADRGYNFLARCRRDMAAMQLNRDVSSEN
jgi:hypothetical protein